MFLWMKMSFKYIRAKLKHKSKKKKLELKLNKRKLVIRARKRNDLSYGQEYTKKYIFLEYGSNGR